MSHHIENDNRYDLYVHRITNLEWGQVKRFIGDMIKTTTSLEHMTSKMEKYLHRTKDMREILIPPMDQHHFPYMHTCEDILFQWPKYDKEHPIYWSPHA